LLYLSQEGGWILKNRIKQIRKEKGLTQVEFGEKIGVKGNTVTNYETGLRKPTDAVILSICREFSVNEEWLRTGEGDMFIIPEDDTAALVSNLLEEPDDEFHQLVLELVRTYEQLSPDSRKVLREFGNMCLNNMKNRKA
jgi:transcriptional regulator with XRE-family HTH domain